MHAGTPRGLANRLGVVAIVFAALDIWFDVLRRNETHRVAKLGQFAGPVMGTAAGFQGNDDGRELLEEGDYLRAAEVGAQDRPLLLIDAM
jgi:hypothetical protein